MSGSRRWFEYIADTGTSYAVELDESNAESVLDGIRIFGDIDGTEPLLPCRLKMRYVNAILSTDNTQRRRFRIGTQALYNSIQAGDAIADNSLVWRILSRRGEVSAFPNPIDTSQLDGDAPQ